MQCIQSQMTYQAMQGMQSEMFYSAAPFYDGHMTGNQFEFAALGGLSVVSSPSELWEILAVTDYAMPFAVRSNRGVTMTVEWHHSGTELCPYPTSDDYPLTITNLSAWSTTLVIKMLPDDFDRDMVAESLNRLGFGGGFDFLYVPFNLWEGVPVAYGFCNMRTHEGALMLKETLHGHKWPGSEKTCEVAWARSQGYYENVEFYRNNSVNHPEIEQNRKPMIYDQNGRPHTICTTRRVKPPKVKNSGRHGDRNRCFQSQGIEEETITAMSNLNTEGVTEAQTRTAVREEEQQVMKLREVMSESEEANGSENVVSSCDTAVPAVRSDKWLQSPAVFESTDEEEDAQLSRITSGSAGPPGLAMPLDSAESGRYWEQFRAPFLGLD